jgi:hypothetical protein
MEESERDVAAEAADRDLHLRRRRRILYAFAGLALAIVVSVGLVDVLKSSDKAKKAKSKATPAQTVTVARLPLMPVRSASGRGVVALTRRAGVGYLRVLAVDLKPCLADEVYQLLLTGGGEKPKLLGNEVVDRNRTFVGQAKIEFSEVSKYRRIELHRVRQGDPPIDRTILRGKLPS